jgi:WD40 repeat protein
MDRKERHSVKHLLLTSLAGLFVSAGSLGVMAYVEGWPRSFPPRIVDGYALLCVWLGGFALLSVGGVAYCMNRYHTDEAVRKKDFDQSTSRLLLRVAWFSGLIGCALFVLPAARVTFWKLPVDGWSPDILWQAGLYPGKDNNLIEVGFSKDGARVLGRTRSDRVRAWNWRGREREPLDGLPPVAEERPPRSQDGRFEADFWSVFGEIIVSKGPGGPPLHSLKAHPHEKIYQVLFVPNTPALYSAGGDGAIRLWDLESGRLRREFHSDPNTKVKRLALSPDGRRLLTVSQGDRQAHIELWDVGSGARLQRYDPSWVHTHQTACLAFSPDGNYAACGMDDTLCLVRLPR